MTGRRSPVADLLRIDTSGGVIKVWHARSARSLDEADAILAAIDAALDRTGLQVLLFDSRDSDRTPPDIQRRIWTWLTEHRELRRVATVMHSTQLGATVRTVGTDLGVRIRAFSSEDEARAWLLHTY